MNDLRYAVRMMRRNPGFTAVAVATLAVGIGATTAIFGAVDAVLLKPLPYPDADRIVTLRQRDLSEGVNQGGSAPGNFLDWRARSRSFEGLAAVEPYALDHMGPEGPERFRSWMVTEGFFEILGIPALVGRTFRDEEHATGAGATVVLSHRLWQSRFHGDPGVVGRILVLDEEATTVVGVMPPGFEFPPGRDVWAPKRFEGWEAENRTSAFWQVVGRLASSATPHSAQAELDGIAAQLALEYPATNARIGISLVPLREQLVANARPALLLLLGAVGVVLLIACVNVANLLLSRAWDREREFALRAALGATSARLVRRLATENLLIAGMGSVGGLLVAAWGMGALQALGPEGIPRIESMGIDARLLAFVLLMTFATALLFGLAPASFTLRRDIRARLHMGAGAVTPSARRFRGGLVTAQLAMATFVLIGAGLLARSFVALLQVERGYRTENVLTMSVQAWGHHPTGAERARFVEETLERIVRLPGVRAAGVTSSLPLAEGIGAEEARFVLVDEPPPEEGQEPTVHTAAITAGYLEALGVPVREGRSFGADDRADAPLVVLVNESLARRYWGNRSPVGSRVTVAFLGPPRTAEVVGVVGDVRHAGLDEEPRPSLFLPHAQVPVGALTFTVHTVGDAGAFTRAIQEEIWVSSPTMPIEEAATLDLLLTASLQERRFNLLLLLAFGVTALVLAAGGTYGLLRYEASRRSREIGVRIALGADRSRIVRLLVGEGLRLALPGVGVGILMALAARQFLSGFVFGVDPFDPLTFLAIGGFLTAVALLASYLPARSASRVDPISTLRDD